jgi:hypothetical protein
MEIIIGSNYCFLLEVSDNRITLKYYDESEANTVNKELKVIFTEANAKRLQCFLNSQICQKETTKFQNYMQYFEKTQTSEFVLSNHRNIK